jgi:hypothetical protein
MHGVQVPEGRAPPVVLRTLSKATREETRSQRRTKVDTRSLDRRNYKMLLRPSLLSLWEHADAGHRNTTLQAPTLLDTRGRVSLGGSDEDICIDFAYFACMDFMECMDFICYNSSDCMDIMDSYVWHVMVVVSFYVIVLSYMHDYMFWSYYIACLSLWTVQIQGKLWEIFKFIHYNTFNFAIIRTMTTTIYHGHETPTASRLIMNTVQRRKRLITSAIKCQ